MSVFVTEVAKCVVVEGCFKAVICKVLETASEVANFASLEITGGLVDSIGLNNMSIKGSGAPDV